MKAVYPDTTNTEMLRLLDECAKLGLENERLRELLVEARGYLGRMGQEGVRERIDACLLNTPSGHDEHVKRAGANGGRTQPILPCRCGGRALGRSRLLVCSNRKCGVLVMQKTHADSIRRWNELFQTDDKNEPDA